MEAVEGERKLRSLEYFIVAKNERFFCKALQIEINDITYKYRMVVGNCARNSNWRNLCFE